MQSRHNVAGIQYQGGLMSDYENISLPAESLARNCVMASVLFFVLIYRHSFVLIRIDSVHTLQWLKYQRLVFSLSEMSKDVNILHHHSLPICTDSSQANASCVSPLGSHTSALDPWVRFRKEGSFIIEMSEGLDWSGNSHKAYFLWIQWIYSKTFSWLNVAATERSDGELDSGTQKQ